MCYLVLKEQAFRSGGYREEVTPGPIPNPEVKLFIGWHSKVLPCEVCTSPVKNSPNVVSFFVEIFYFLYIIFFKSF